MIENSTMSCHSLNVINHNLSFLKKLIILNIDLGQLHGSDARQEIKKYGREGTGKKYMELQNARREMILKQRVINIIEKSNQFLILELRNRWNGI